LAKRFCTSSALGASDAESRPEGEGVLFLFDLLRGGAVSTLGASDAESRGRGISVAGTPERSAVVQRAKELVEFARGQGYRLDELVEIIEDVG
jgi:hypothetical protein